MWRIDHLDGEIRGRVLGPGLNGPVAHEDCAVEVWRCDALDALVLVISDELRHFHGIASRAGLEVAIVEEVIVAECRSRRTSRGTIARTIWTLGS